MEAPPVPAAVAAARRGRRPARGSEEPADEEEEGFIPVACRSRSAPGGHRRLRSKTTPAELASGDSVAEEELEEGSRYFSQRAERAGLEE